MWNTTGEWVKVRSLDATSQGPNRFTGNVAFSSATGEISTCLSRGVLMWDLESFQISHTYMLPDSAPEHDLRMFCIADTGAYIAGVGRSDALYIWNTQTRSQSQNVRVFKFPSDVYNFLHCAFVTTYAIVGLLTTDALVFVDVVKGSVVLKIESPDPQSAPFSTFTVSEQGNTAIIVKIDGTLLCYDLKKVFAVQKNDDVKLSIAHSGTSSEQSVSEDSGSISSDDFSVSEAPSQPQRRGTHAHTHTHTCMYVCAMFII
jgi:hypothetical protein